MSDGKPGGMAGLLDRLLSYVDAPWKIGAVVVLVATGGIAWVLYQHHAEIVENWMTPSETTLRQDLVVQALETLASETDADLVQIWAIDLPANAQTFVAARRRDGERPVIPTPRRLPVIASATDAKAVVDVLNGTPICLDLTTMGTPLAERLASRGMKRGCAIPIPPGGADFVGIIYLVWLTAPDARAESVAVGVARDIARTLATR